MVSQCWTHGGGGEFRCSSETEIPLMPSTTNSDLQWLKLLVFGTAPLILMKPGPPHKQGFKSARHCAPAPMCQQAAQRVLGEGFRAVILHGPIILRRSSSCSTQVDSVPVMET